LVDADHVADFEQIRRNRNHLAIHLKEAVPRKLAALRQGAREPELVHDVVKPPLKEREQIFAGNARHPLGQLKIARELLFEQSVDALDLLLFAQPDCKFRKSRTRLPVCTGRIVAPLDRALVAETALALQKQLQPFPPTEPAHWSEVSCH